MKNYHILNGNSLKTIFPSKIEGEKIICRECLVDGNVQGDSLKELYINRAIFLSSYFPDRNMSNDEYLNVSNEFEKIQSIPENSIIHLWFEEDLFCQVNLWFMLYLISSNNKKYSISLVLPSKECKYSFYEMSADALADSFNRKLEIKEEEFTVLTKFWELFKSNNPEKVYCLAESLGEKYTFLLPTIKAWQENRPKSTLKKILAKNEHADFWTIFKMFKLKEAIYGFGDLQVKRLLSEIKDGK